MVLCLLATDDEEDVALQIHFTLIQAFCCENDINILRVSNMRRLAEILGGVKPGGEPMDLHCVLVTVSVITHVLQNILLTSFQTVKRGSVRFSTKANVNTCKELLLAVVVQS